MKGNTTVLASPARQVSALVAAAHELKAPLVVIRHLTQALADKELLLSPAEQRQHIERLFFTSERMMRLVQQLTLSYRLDTDQQMQFAFAIEPINVAEVCAQALHEMAPYAREYQQDLQLYVKQPHVVIANRDILFDIVVNLVDNAIRHNKSGGAVRLDSRVFGDAVRLNVHDNGVGIAPSELPRLKNTIGKQAQPLSGRPGTSGLGLYIASQFAEAMGGDLGVGRRPSGATFFVNLIRSRQMSLL